MRLVIYAALLASAMAPASLAAQQSVPAGKIDNALGVKLAPVPDLLYAHLALERGQGLLVESVKGDSRAAAFGLKAFDVLVAIGTAPIKNSDDLQQKLLALPPGEREVLQIIRGGKQFALTIANPGPYTAIYAPPKSLFKAGGPPALGVEIKPLTAGMLEVNLFYLNQANKMERHELHGTLDDIEGQITNLAKNGHMPDNIHDLVSPVLKRLRTKNQK